MTKWVYHFGADRNEGRADMRDLLGGKGANLAEMASIGLPVPPGFTITTEVCTAYYAGGKTYPAELEAQVRDGLAAIEKSVGLGFGDAGKPLLVSVRSGARVSMPGMMDTVLNLGLNDETVVGLERASGDARFAWDSYRRFIQMYGSVVLGVDHHRFEDIIETAKLDRGVIEDTALTAEDWQAVVSDYKDMVAQETGQPFPMDPNEQLWGAIGAVFGSWMNPRANTYRRLHDIPADWGTAVNVQAMVFGNMGEDCATGVCFTRDPSTGANMFYGEYLVNAQGEDVVAGIRTPQPMSAAVAKAGEVAMETAMPAAYAELMAVRDKLERHYTDMQDIEFTVQANRLYMLQTRSGKRTAAASLRIAVEMAQEGLIDRNEAIRRINPASLDQLLHPMLDPNAKRALLSKGLPASPGAASGVVVFSADEAEMRAAKGESVILVRIETSPEDIHGMHAARGILTTRGGMTSHAAVVARGMGRPCVAGAGGISVDYGARILSAGGQMVRAGEYLTLDGATGEVFVGQVAMIEPVMSGELATLMSWADAARRMRVRTNAETPLDAETARKFGAEGIGLCRTEHMFFDPARIGAVRQMIMAQDERGRRTALARLLPFQRQDFHELFRIMAGLPVTIRLLDPPLHEFLPHGEAELAEIAEALGGDLETMRRRAADLAEANPMLGHRGCRLGIAYPEIYEMQARAIFEGAILAARESGEAPVPEIMIPLVGIHRELQITRAQIERVAAEVFAEQGFTLDYSVGTMIELPRACMVADRIAEDADFFSFGTNDLTQTVFGLSRDDAGKFLPAYVDAAGILPKDPFVSLDIDGVGALVQIAADRGRSAKPKLKLGICGEHGGDPASIAFCEAVGLDYVSCSPYRVPVARLAAAQAALRDGGDRSLEGREGKRPFVAAPSGATEDRLAAASLPVPSFAMIDPAIPRAALITGGARRLGRGIVLALAEAGFSVAIHCRRSVAEAEATAAEARASGVRAVVLAADLADEAAVAGLVPAAIDGLGPVGVLVNNASTFERDEWHDATRASWDAHLEPNLRAPFVLIQRFAALLPEGARGAVINMLDERVWSLTPHFVSYTVSKAGLWAITQSMALALAPRIRVNGIGPGPAVPSPRQTPAQFARQAASVPLGHATSPEEVGRAVLGVLGLPSFTGQMLALDGGQHLQWQPGSGAAPIEE